MKFRGSARVGLVRLGWPFTPTLWVDKEGIRLDGLRPFQLKKAEVKRLEYTGRFSEGILIVHSNRSVPSWLVFRPAKPFDLLTAAKDLGYETISTKKI